MSTWLPCPGYEGLYEVSDDGRVRRVAAVRGSRVGYELAGMVDGHGYRTYTLRKEKLFRSEKAHRLVCAAFNGPPPEGRTHVNHKDGSRLNNTAGNLEWVSHTENMRHAFALGLVDLTSRRGANNPKARAVRRIDKDGTHTDYKTLREAHADTPKSRADRISQAARGKFKTHAGFRWQLL